MIVLFYPLNKEIDTIRITSVIEVLVIEYYINWIQIDPLYPFENYMDYFKRIGAKTNKCFGCKNFLVT